MEPEDVERLIESAIPDASAEVTAPRPNDDDHLAVTVVSPVFEGKPLVEQHEMVFDAVDEHMTTDIHALKVTTRAPGEIETDFED
ncbi:MAG: stress-induced morphogen [Halobacteriales archaeon]|jgi:stress-induced morphogen